MARNSIEFECWKCDTTGEILTGDPMICPNPDCGVDIALGPIPVEMDEDGNLKIIKAETPPTAASN